MNANKNLTGTEAGIAALVAKGYTNKEIAKELGTSPATVRDHVQSIMQKCRVLNRTALAVYLVLKKEVTVTVKELQKHALLAAKLFLLGCFHLTSLGQLDHDTLRNSNRVPTYRPARREHGHT